MFVAPSLVNFFSEDPEINGFVSYSRNGRAIKALIVETIKLLQEVELGSRRRLYGVQTLHPGLEPKGLEI